MALLSKEKIVKGVSWSLVDKKELQGIKFVVGILFARSLAPENFQFIGMITVFFTITDVFIQSDFGQASVQKKIVSNDGVYTVFFTNFLVSIVLYIILWFSAPLMAKFYDQPQLVELTRNKRNSEIFYLNLYLKQYGCFSASVERSY